MILSDYSATLLNMKSRKIAIIAISALALCAAFVSCKKADKTAALMQNAGANEYALREAVKNDDIFVVRQLILAGADVDAKDNDGKTALMRAEERNATDVMELLKAAGAKE